MILLLFILIPVFEIAGFILIGDAIGILASIALTILTAMVGATVLKSQGMATFTSAKQRMDDDSFPFKEMLEGICLFIAGIFLVIPGFVTDFFGALLLIQPIRLFLSNIIIDNQKKAMDTGFSSQEVFNDNERPQHKMGNKTIEAEYTKIKD